MLLILSYLPPSLHAQNNKGLDRTQIKAPDKTVEIDSVTGLVSGSIPFDQNFILKKIYKADVEPFIFEVHEIDKDGSERKTPKRRLVNNYLDLYEHRRPRRWRYKNSKMGSFSKDSLIFQDYKAFLKVHFESDFTQYNHPFNIQENFEIINVDSSKQAVYYYVPQLNPGREYRFTFINTNNPLLNKLYSIGDSFSKEDTFQAFQEFNTIRTNNDVKVRDKRWRFGEFKEFEAFMKTSKIRIPNPHLKNIANTHYINPKGEFYLFEISKYNTEKNKKPHHGNKLLEDTLKKTTIESLRYHEFVLGTYSGLRTSPLLLDSEGNEIVKDKSYYFAFDLNINNRDSVSTPSRAYKYNGTFFEINPDDRDLTHDFPIELIRSPYINFKEIGIDIASISSPLPIVDSLSTDILLKYVIKAAYNIDCSKASKLQDLLCKNPKSFNLSAQKVLAYKLFKWKQILKGYLPINYDALDEAAVEHAYNDRSKNLSTTIKFIALLLNLAEILESIESTSYDGLEQKMDTLNKLLELNKEKLDAAHTKQLTIKRALNDLDYVYSASHHAGTTDVFEFKIRNTFRIVPDFGVIVVWRGTSAYAISDITPYLGFRINLRPINKDVPFRLVRYKTIMHRLSIMSGVTLSSLNIAGQREDLFARFSLLTGVGFRLNNVVKVTGGTVWFKAMDPNPGIDRKRLAFSPYAGLSLDLDLQDLFGGISKLLN